MVYWPLLTVCCSEPAVSCWFTSPNRDFLRLLSDTFGLKHVQTPVQHSSRPLLSVRWVLPASPSTSGGWKSNLAVHQMIFSVISFWPKRVRSWGVKMKRSIWWTLSALYSHERFSSWHSCPFRFFAHHSSWSFFSCYEPGLYLSSSSFEVIWCLYCAFYSHRMSLEAWLFFRAPRKVLSNAFSSILTEHRLVWCDCCHSKVANFSVAFSSQAAEKVFPSSRVEIITLFRISTH